MAVAKERRRRMELDFTPPFPFLVVMIHDDMTFELVMISLVAANALLTGVQISFSGTDNNSEIYDILEYTFTGAFVVEIILRVMADGWLWFFDRGNFFDFSLIMFTGVIPTFLGPALNMSDDPLIKCGQALRCARLVRILKKVRAKFQTLWSLVNGIAQSGRILFWTSVILVVILYMFAIFGVLLLRGTDLNFDSEQQEVVDIHFPEIIGAMFSLFQIMTLDSWTGISRPLHKSYWFIGIYFMAFVCVACMVLQNLIVAVICNNAFKSVEEDTELQASIAQKNLEDELASLREIFELMDDDESDCLSKDEYEAGLKAIPELPFKLKVAGLSDEEIDDLWDFLSLPEQLDGDTFTTQLRALKGDAKSKDSFKVTVSLKKLTRRIEKATYRLEVHRRYCEVLQKDVIALQQLVGSVMHDVRFFMVTTMRCIPADPVPMTKKKIEAVSQEMVKKASPNMTPILTREHERRPLDQKKLVSAFALPGQIEDVPKPQGVPGRMAILDQGAEEEDDPDAKKTKTQIMQDNARRASVLKQGRRLSLVNSDR